jgi:hypothetical protein
MNKTKPTPIGQLLLLGSSDRWSSAILNQLELSDLPMQLRLFGNSTELVTQLEGFPNRMILVELSESLLSSDRALAGLLASHSARDCLLALGNHKTNLDHLDLIQAGFSEAFHSTAHVSRLLKLAVNWFANHPNSSLTIEEKVIRDLPWKSNSR